MNIKRIATAISLIAVMIIVTACDNGQSMMHENNSMDKYNWNLPQIIFSLLIGFIIGFLVGRRKR